MGDLQQYEPILVNDEYGIGRIPYAPGVVLDIGANIGLFALAWHRRWPRNPIICVEPCPEHIEILTANVGGFAGVRQAACTYEPGAARLQTCMVGGQATCTSYLDWGENTEFRAEVDPTRLDERPVEKVNIDELLHGQECHVLKLDCEGSELSILRHMPQPAICRHIIGEYHSREPFEKILQERFADWKINLRPTNDRLGLFRMDRP